MIFRRIVFSALLVGLIAGLLVTAIQLWQVVPIIQGAEVFEGGAPSPAPLPGDINGSSSVGAGDGNHDHTAHEHSGDEWAPEDGLERSTYTLFVNVLNAFAFALLVLAGIMVSVKIKAVSQLRWVHGILWASAGYIIFFAAPALGLPPEIPGMAAAPLQERQIWWLMTIILTATGLGIVAFTKSPWRFAALLLLVIPHVIGAPHPGGTMFAGHPAEAVAQLEKLASQFITATAIANAILWLSLGLASIWAARRYLLPLA